MFLPPDEMAPTNSRRQFNRLGIVGVGLMGVGIAQVALQQGISVVLFDTDPAAARRGREDVISRMQALADKGRLSADDVAEAANQINVASDLEPVASADAVIEAVIERLDAKQEVFRKLSAVAGHDTLLATNTSAISVSEIAALASFPEQVVGMHFFAPVPSMPLCEVVRGFRTTDDTASAALQLAKAMGKESIIVNRDDAGFVTSRLISVLIHEAIRLVEQGLASAEDVDRACVLGFGHKMGPLETADLTGLDVALRAGRAIYDGSGDPTFRPPQLLARMVAAGILGRKSGEGFYKYS